MQIYIYSASLHNLKKQIRYYDERATRYLPSLILYFLFCLRKKLPNNCSYLVQESPVITVHKEHHQYA